MSINFVELWEKTIQSQYGTSPHIMGIVEKFAEQIDPNMAIDEFFTKIFDPRTAEGIGLDIWGAIVGVDRKLEVDEGEYFGFFGSLLHPFDEQPFYYEKGVTKVYNLADNAYRQLIFLKAFANIADATLPNIKRITDALYKGSTAINSGTMKVRILFNTYNISSFSLALLKKYGLLNLGAGVGWEYYIVDEKETFGFNGSGLQPFDQGIFASYPIYRLEDMGYYIVDNTDTFGFNGSGLQPFGQGTFVKYEINEDF